MTQLLQVAGLQQIIDDTNLIIIDCRSDLSDRPKSIQLYLSGHIPGAIHANLEVDLSGPIIPGTTGRHPLPSTEQWQTTLRNWGVTKTSKIVVYDQAIGAFAARAWWMMKWAGLSDVRLLDGGLDAWVAETHSLDQTIPTPSTSTISIETQKAWTVSATQLCKEFNSSVILDARAIERYKGDVEPLDTKAGHIPTAQNADHTKNIGPNNHFVDSSELANRFNSLTNQNVICYCGSGVTACHNIFAIVQAGLPMPRLYPGSWSEWITDPSHEINTGIEGEVL